MNLLLTGTAISLTLLAPMGIAVGGAPRAGMPVLVILPPWADAEAIVARAGGQNISPVAAPFATIASSEDPAFAARLQNLGVWAVRDASRLSQLCGASL
ncbi:MAG: hypothetical protein ACK4RZ_01370 [Paracoccaceae bacterium]